MLRANPEGFMSKNNPANRTVADHLKQGVKNIPKMYNTLYGSQGGMSGPKQMLKVAATGKTSSQLDTKVSAAKRAKIVGMGAASVTPLGPVAAFASGVAKSVKDMNKAKAKAAAPPAAPKQVVMNRKPGAPMVGGGGGEAAGGAGAEDGRGSGFAAEWEGDDGRAGGARDASAAEDSGGHAAVADASIAEDAAEGVGSPAQLLTGSLNHCPPGRTKPPW